MSSFMNQYYYGKAGKGDFTEDQLPTNRFQLFFTTLRLHLGGLVGMNCLYILFAFPLLMWSLMNFSMIMSILSEDTGMDLISYAGIYAIGLVPCFALVGIGMSGMAYVLRNWARDQHTFTMSDFKDSLKTNWKLGLLGGLTTGLVLMVAWFGYVFYGQLANNRSVFFTVPQVMTLTLCGLILMSSMLFYPMMVTYDLKFRHVLRNSLLITLRRLPLSVLVFVLPIGIPFMVVFFFGGNQYVALVVTLFYMIIGFALTAFIQISYANSCLEKYLNPLIEGAQTNIGMRDKTQDELDDEEEEKDE